MSKEESKEEQQESGKDQVSLSQKNSVEPDVVLNVPKLKIGEVQLDVEKLDAKISLKAQLANFINIDVGTNVHVENVKLDLKEVDAEATLKVRLERVERILLKAIDYLEDHPEVLKSMGTRSDGDKE